MTRSDSNITQPKESLVIISLVFLLLGSDVLFSQQFFDRYYGHIEGPQAFLIGLAMAGYGLYGCFLYFRSLLFSTSASVVRLVAVFLCCVGGQAILSLFSPSIFIMTVRFGGFFVCLVFAHIYHRSAKKALGVGCKNSSVPKRRL